MDFPFHRDIKFQTFSASREFFSNCTRYSADSLKLSESKTTFGKFSRNFWFNRDDHIILTNFTNLKMIFNCLVSPIGKYVILTQGLSRMDERDLKTLFEKQWKQIGALEVYLYLNSSVYYYQPFEQNEKLIFGKLKKFDEKFQRETFKNFNGYQLSVEVFKGTLTFGRYKNKGTIFKDIFGPDIDVLLFLSKVMNFTSKNLMKI